MLGTLIKDQIDIVSKFYLIEKCFSCQFVYAHEIKEDSVDTIIENFKSHELRNQNGDVMRGIDCPHCKSKNTRFINLYEKFLF